MTITARRGLASRGLWLVACLLCAVPAPAAAQNTTPAAPQEKPIGEAPEERDAGDIFLRGQRVLLARGDVVVDVGQFYSRSDSLQLALIDGTVTLATSQQALLSTFVVGRVGVLNETEVFAGATFLHQTNRLFVGTTDLARGERNDLGDVSVGVRRTLLREGAGRPDIVATFDAVIPTGDTPYAVGGGLVFVKNIDPVVLFANGGYHRRLRRDLSDGGSIDPGDAVDVSFGYALALNDSLAISTAAAGVFADTLAVDGGTTRRVDAFSVRFALTSSLAKGLYIEPSVSIGLSGPNNTFAFGVTLPYSF